MKSTKLESNKIRKDQEAKNYFLQKKKSRFISVVGRKKITAKS